MDDPRAFLERVKAARDSLPHGRRPTDTHVKVAAKLAFWRGGHPSHRVLARACKCDRKTVQRALARLEALGLLAHAPRYACGPGWRRRLSNAYFDTGVRGRPIIIHCSPILPTPSAPALAAQLDASRERATRAWEVRRRRGVPVAV